MEMSLCYSRLFKTRIQQASVEIRRDDTEDSREKEKYPLTVLGLVRFLASVSQLLRWLYVLLLSDNTRTEVSVEAIRCNVTPPQRTGGHKRTLSNSASRVGSVSAAVKLQACLFSSRSARSEASST